MSLFETLQTDRKASLYCMAVASAFALGYIAYDGANRYNQLVGESLFYTDFPKPRIDVSSRTGYENGVRTIIFPEQGIDGLQWITHAQSMVAEGRWRTRFTDIDNSPDGREVHWSQAFLWWLIGLGKLYCFAFGQPTSSAIESSAVFANALLFGILATATTRLVFRRWGAVPAAFLLLAMTNTLGFSSAFSIGVPDHHGMAAACVLFSILLPVLGGGGWVCVNEPMASRKTVAGRNSSPGFQDAQRYFIAAGIAGGMGLWISAASALPAIVFIGCGALASGFYASKCEWLGCRYASELWRRWGLAGGVTSMIGYLVEYFPNHIGFRLEVNHPLYASAWIGGGHLLARLIDRFGPSSPPTLSRMSKLGLGLSSLFILVPAVLIVGYPQYFFWVGNPFLWKLHSEHIREFESLIRFTLEGHWGFFLWNSLVISFCVLPALRLLRTATIERTWIGKVILVLVPTLLFVVLGILQMRWLVFAFAGCIVLLPTSMAGLTTVSNKNLFSIFEKVLLGVGAGLAFGAVPLLSVIAGQSRPTDQMVVSRERAEHIHLRHLAHFLRSRRPIGEIVVLSGPGYSTELSYYGGFKSVGTLYWENLKGLEAASQIFASRSEEAVIALLKQHRITHLVLPAGDRAIDDYYGLAEEPNRVSSRKSVIRSWLETDDLPPWLVPIPFPNEPLYNHFRVTIFEIDFKLDTGRTPTLGLQIRE